MNLYIMRVADKSARFWVVVSEQGKILHRSKRGESKMEAVLEVVDKAGVTYGIMVTRYPGILSMSQAATAIADIAEKYKKRFE